MTLCEQLISHKLVPNEFVLTLNSCIRVPTWFKLEGVWAARSRAFMFPIRYVKEKLFLASDFLKAHPFVQHVEKVLAMDIPVNEEANRYSGYHHAIDLICGNNLDVLMDTKELTCEDEICAAIVVALRIADKDGNMLSLKDAKRLLSDMGTKEPENCKLLKSFMAPAELVDEEKASYWPINHVGNACPFELAWTFIHAIENGYFQGYGKGCLGWSKAGIDYYHGKSYGLLL